MMKISGVLILFVALLTQPAFSESAHWWDRAGNPVAGNDARKIRDGFGGSLLLVTDEDWERKWNAPPETSPEFTAADKVPYGEKVFVLILFNNPKRNAQGKTRLMCDIQFTSPEGEAVFLRKDLVCHSGQIEGSPYSHYLADPVITFMGEPGDLPGVLTVDVKLRDALRGVELPLRGTFTLVGDSPTGSSGQ